MIPTTTEQTSPLPSSQAKPLLVLNKVSKHFPIHSGFFNKVTGAIQAVNNVDLTVYEGETIGIVGESGCGKSTLARCILQLIRPTQGQVLFQGNDLCQLPQAQLRSLRKNFQMIFQNPYASLNPKMTVEQIITEPYEVHHILRGIERKNEVAKLLDLVGLPKNALEKFPHELSGGQCQRVGIARALTLKPKLIIADEAVSALDVSVQAQIINLLQDLKTTFGLTYIFISHNMSVVEYISDRVAVMYLGEIVETAKSEDLYKNPRHPYTQALLSAVPSPNPAQKHRKRILLQDDLPSPANPPSGCRFHTRCQYETALCHSTEPTLEPINQFYHEVSCHHEKTIPVFAR